ncbi:GNAT family N-acetyltransferase [Clostridiaceae bacterium M8S5]|nr:GNAT family N-acetyltransferase [Clostridiaceae bacterium M8S5]
MIISKLAKNNSEFKQIDEFYKAELNQNMDSSKKDIVYIIKENSRLLGTCIINIQDELAILEKIYIIKEYRGNRIGDGLLRASLNYALSKGLIKIYCDNKSEFLIKEGFFNCDEDNLCDINSFFTKTKCGDK